MLIFVSVKEYRTQLSHRLIQSQVLLSPLYPINLAGEVPEDRISSLRRRLELDSRSCMPFLVHDKVEEGRAVARSDQTAVVFL